MAFHLGSLGFLTPFEFSNYQEQVANVLEGEPFSAALNEMVNFSAQLSSSFLIYKLHKPFVFPSSIVFIWQFAF